jgi:hypothetical protein
VYILVTLSFIFEACSFIYYAPNQPHIPILRERNDFEFRASGGGELLGDVDVIEAQIAYSPLKYWSISYNTAYFFSDRSNNNHGNSILHEFGTGFYIPLTKYLYMSGNATYAKNRVYHYYDIPQHSRYDIQRWSFTPALHIGNKFFNVYGGLRFSSLRFSNGVIPLNARVEEKAELEFLLRKDKFLVVEQTIGVKGGYKFIFLGFQHTYINSFQMQLNDRKLYASYMFALVLSINQEIFNIKNKEVKSPGTLY